MIEIDIADSFEQDIVEITDSLEALSNNSVLYQHNISKIKTVADSIDILPHDSGIVITDLLKQIDNLKDEITDYISDLSAKAVIIQSNMQMILDIVTSAESSSEKNEALKDLIKGIESISKFLKLKKNEELTEEEKLLLEQWDLLDQENKNVLALRDWLANYLTEHPKLDKEKYEHIADFTESVGLAITNKAVKDTIEKHFGQYGMEVVKIFEGLVIHGDPNLLPRLVSSAKTFIKDNLLEVSEETTKTMGLTAKKSAGKGVGFLDQIPATFVTNISLALISDAMEDGDVNLAKDLTSATWSTLATHMAEGFVGGGIYGAVAAATLDVIGTYFIESQYEEWEKQEKLKYFSKEDLTTIESNDLNICLIDDDRVKPGTTTFDAERDMKKYGFSEEAASFVSGLNNNANNKDIITEVAHGKMPPDLQAILDYENSRRNGEYNIESANGEHGASGTSNNNFSSIEQEQQYNNISKLLSSNDDLKAYAEMIYDNYYSDIKYVKDLETDEWIRNNLSDPLINLVGDGTGAVSSDIPI